MRLPGGHRDCGPLIELGWVSRLLHLGRPVTEGLDTVAVAQIVGTVNRGRDFDGCWRPTERRLAKTLDEIEAAKPVGIDEPIDLVRIDRAYFVSDGHKRVALAKRSGREFLDARVSRLPTPYELSPDIETDAILRTAREGEFRRHSGVDAVEPEARFALSDIDAYGELLTAVQSYAYALGERDGRLPSRADAAADWYRADYLPTVVQIRRDIGDVLGPYTDADLYLLVHRQRLALWGTECDAPECAVHQVLTRSRLEARGRTPLGRVLAHGMASGPHAPLLPFTHPDGDEPS